MRYKQGRDQDKQKWRHFAMTSLQWLCYNYFVAKVFVSPVRLYSEKRLPCFLTAGSTAKHRFVFEDV